jgi:hypothetical protein
VFELFHPVPEVLYCVHHGASIWQLHPVVQIVYPPFDFGEFVGDDITLDMNIPANSDVTRDVDIPSDVGIPFNVNVSLDTDVTAEIRGGITPVAVSQDVTALDLALPDVLYFFQFLDYAFALAAWPQPGRSIDPEQARVGKGAVNIHRSIKPLCHGASRPSLIPYSTAETLATGVFRHEKLSVTVG